MNSSICSILLFGLMIITQSYEREIKSNNLLLDVNSSTNGEKHGMQRNWTKMNISKRNRFLSKRLRNSAHFSVGRSKRNDFQSYVQKPVYFDTNRFGKTDRDVDSERRWHGYSLEVQPGFTQINLRVPVDSSDNLYVEPIAVGHRIIMHPPETLELSSINPQSAEKIDSNIASSTFRSTALSDVEDSTTESTHTTKVMFIDPENENEFIARPTEENLASLFEGSGDFDSRLVRNNGTEANPTENSERFFDLFINSLSSNDTCRTPKGEAGQCRSMRECVLQDVINNLSTIRQYMCITRSTIVGICCPDNPVIEVTNPDVDGATPEEIDVGDGQPPDGCGVNSRTRIVGGIIAKPHEWTWMVALLKNNKFFCGGVLINSRYVLTAAHCVMSSNIRDITARFGEHDLDDPLQHQQDIRLAEVKRHAKFTTLTFQNDIALLKLRRAVEFSRFVGTICLPKADSNYTNISATVAGWGTLAFGGPASTILRQVTVPVWDNEDCDRTYSLETINESFLCAGSKIKEQDACQGDSGGPLMVLNSVGRWEVIGLVSWGRRCGDPNFPGVYTRVTTYLDWIRENTQ